MRALRPVGLLLLAGCVGRYVEPVTPAERPPVAVTAGFDATWEGVIAEFARRTWPIAVVEKASGIITTPAMVVRDTVAALRWADCGRITSGWTGDGGRLLPDFGQFNVFVRPGDDGHAILRATARWTFTGATEARGLYCESRGVFERELEERIKEYAESRRRN